MSFDVLGPVLAVLVIFAALIVVLRYLKAKDKSFTFRVFTALGMGIVLGAGIQLALGRGSDAATAALDWMSLVGTGYIDLLRMLVMPLVFVAIVGAFTRTKAVDNLGKIGGIGACRPADHGGNRGVVRLGDHRPVGPCRGNVTQGSVDATKLDALQTRQDKVADTTIPQTILSMIPVNVFADLAGTRSTSTIAVVIFSAIVGLAYLKLRDRDSEQAQFFSNLIDSLYGIVMCIVKMVVGLTPTACSPLSRMWPLPAITPPSSTWASSSSSATWPSSPCSWCTCSSWPATASTL